MMSCRGLQSMTYAMIGFILSFMVVLIVGVDVVWIHYMSGELCVSILLNVVALWAQSPAQPLIDSSRAPAHEQTIVHNYVRPQNPNL